MKNEEKKERFKRLAASRTNEVIKRLKILSNCANRSAYDYSEDDIVKIFLAIDKSVKESRTKFYFPSHSRKFEL